MYRGWRPPALQNYVFHVCLASAFPKTAKKHVNIEVSATAYSGSAKNTSFLEHFERACGQTHVKYGKMSLTEPANHVNYDTLSISEPSRQVKYNRLSLAEPSRHVKYDRLSLPAPSRHVDYFKLSLPEPPRSLFHCVFTRFGAAA